MSSWIRRSDPGCWSGLFLAGILAAGPAADAGFTVTDLGLAGLGRSSGATAINAQGATSGVVSGYGISNAVESAPGAGFHAINTSSLAGATSSSAAAINGSGDVTGSFYDSIDNQTHAFKTMGNQSIDLGSFSSGRFRGASTAGVAINTSGEVLGNAALSDGEKVVFRSSGPGQLSQITLPGGSLAGQAAGLNSAGTAVGSYTTSLGISRVFVAAEGQPATDLLSHYPVRGFGLNTYGAAINTVGDVTGYGDVNGQSHAFFASAKGTFIDIGASSGFGSSISIGINDQGQVVGQMSNNGASSRAFFWDQTAGLFDLNSLLSPADSNNWILTSASGINDSDQISGQGYINGQLHGFLLTPVPGSLPFLPSATVPTPPSVWLAVVGIGVAGGCRRLRRGRTEVRANA